MAGGERGATGTGKPHRRGTEGTAAPAFSSARGRAREDRSRAARSTPRSPLPPSQQGATPQKHQTNCNSRESNRNSSSTASQTGSRCQHRTCQQLPLGDMEPNPHGVSSVLSQPRVQVLSRGSKAVPGSCSIILPTPRAPPVSATATPIQKGPAPARWSCRDAAGAAQPHSGFPAGTGGTHQSPQGPQWPSAKSSTKGNCQGALGPSFLPAKPMHRAGNALKQL